MTAVVEQRMDFRAASARVGKDCADASWLRDLRARAAELASQMEWPNSRAERPWKYYDPSTLGVTPESPLASEQHTSSGGEGASVVPFATAEGEAAQTIARYLGTGVNPERDRVTALHYAFLRDGLLVHAPANAEVAQPVRLSRHVSGAGLSAPHTLIVTGANTSVTVVEEFTSSEEDIVVAPIAEIVPGPGSQVRYYCVHRWGAKTKVLANQRFLGVERDAEFQNLQLVLGGAVVKGHLASTLEARGTASELLGVAYGRGSEHSDFFTLQDHIGPDTRSDLEYKSALEGESAAVYYGLTKVGLGAKNADANQENRNLLLSKMAKADSDPVLEILTSDIVRASHGATAGPVDQEQLFYMQARGIPYDDAEALLVHAFLESVLARVPHEGLREELVGMLAEALD